MSSGLQVIASQIYPGIISWGLQRLVLNALFFFTPRSPEIYPRGLGHSVIDVQRSMFQRSTIDDLRSTFWHSVIGDRR
jgi:hypothetical protein